MYFDKMLIMAFFTFLMGIFWYIFKYNDVRLAFFCLKFILALVVVKIIILFQYNDLCEASKDMYCR